MIKYNTLLYTNILVLNAPALEKKKREKIKKVSKQDKFQFIENRVSYLPTKRRATIDILLLEVNIIITT